MANETNKITTVYDFKAGDQSALKAIKEAEKAEKRLNDAMESGSKDAARAAEQAASAIEEIGTSATDSARSLSDIYEEMRRSSDAIQSSTSDMDAFDASVRKSVGSVRDLANEAKDVPGSINKDTFGDSSTGLSGLAGATNALGFSGAGGALQLGADISGAAEQLPKLGASVAQFAAGLGPVGVAVTATAAIIGVAVAAMIASQKDLNAQISAGIKANADIERQIASGLTVDDAKAKIDELNKQREAELQIIEKEKQSRQEAATAASAQFGILGGAALAFVNATSDAEETSAQVQAEAEENARKYQAEIDRLNKAIAGGELVGNTAAQTIDGFSASFQGLTGDGLNFASVVDGIGTSLGVTADTAGNVGSAINGFVNTGLSALTGGLQTGIGALNEIAAAEAARTAILQQAADAINKAAAAEDALNAKRALSDSRAAEDAGIAAARAGAAQAAALADAKQAETEKLAQIAQSGADKLADIQQQLAEGVDNYYKQIAAEQANYQQQSAREQEDFDREQKRARRDYRKELERIEKEANASTLDALLNNDFGSIIAAQQNAAEQKAAAKDEFKTGKNDAEEDFKVQQQREAEAHQQRLADLDAELGKFQADSAAKIAQTQAETAAALAAQEQTFNDQMAKEAQKRALAEQYAAEDNALKQKRLAEDRAIEDAAAQAKLDADLARITEKADAETAAQVKVLEVVNNVDNALVGVLAKAQQLATSAANSAGGLDVNPSPGSVTIPKFANEGIIPKDSIYRAGDVGAGEREAVVRFKESEGLGASLARRTGGGAGGGATFAPVIHINNPVIADVVGLQQVRSELTDALNQYDDELVSSLGEGIARARKLKAKV